MKQQNKTLIDWKHLISRSFSLPCSGFFSPFPHGTSSLLIKVVFLGLEGGPTIFQQNWFSLYSNYLFKNKITNFYGAFTLFGKRFQTMFQNRYFVLVK